MEGLWLVTASTKTGDTQSDVARSGGTKGARPCRPERKTSRVTTKLLVSGFLVSQPLGIHHSSITAGCEHAQQVGGERQSSTCFSPCVSRRRREHMFIKLTGRMQLASYIGTVLAILVITQDPFKIASDQFC